VEPEEIARAVFKVLATHVNAGEIEDIKSSCHRNSRNSGTIDFKKKIF
jgi:uncharacterized protein (DUF2267 family)